MIGPDDAEVKTLEEEDRQKLQRFIDEDHPLKDILIWVALPCLRPCRRRLPKCIPKQPSREELDAWE